MSGFDNRIMLILALAVLLPGWPFPAWAQQGFCGFNSIGDWICEKSGTSAGNAKAPAAGTTARSRPAPQYPSASLYVIPQAQGMGSGQPTASIHGLATRLNESLKQAKQQLASAGGAAGGGAALQSQSLASNVSLSGAPLASCAAPSGAGRTYYVAKGGTGTCATATSKGGAVGSITAGLKCLKSGDTLIIGGGTYAEGINNNVPSGTSWNTATVVRSAPGETVILKPTNGRGAYFGTYRDSSDTNDHHIVINGLVFDGSNSTGNCAQVGDGAHHIRLQNNEMRNCTGNGIHSRGNNIELLYNHVHHNGISGYEHGFYINGDNVLIEGNDIHHNAGAGIQVSTSGGNLPTNITIRGNKSYSNGTKAESRGIIVYSTSGKNIAVYNNVVWDNHDGIRVDNTGARVYNNTAYQNAVGIRVTSSNNSRDMVVRDNIAYQNRTNISNSGTNTALSNNFTADPGFADPKNGNFCLKSGSPAQGKGADCAKVGPSAACQ